MASKLHDTPDDAPPHLVFLAERIVTNVKASTVIGAKIELVKQGHEWRGKSPFVGTNTRDFYVNDEHGFYHCFASKRRGDLVRFVMETEGKTYTEAVTYLASFLGVRQPL